jgi:hypothetical protein
LRGRGRGCILREQAYREDGGQGNQQPKQEEANEQLAEIRLTE